MTLIEIRVFSKFLDIAFTINYQFSFIDQAS